MTSKTPEGLSSTCRVQDWGCCSSFLVVFFFFFFFFFDIFLSIFDLSCCTISRNISGKIIEPSRRYHHHPLEAFFFFL